MNKRRGEKTPPLEPRSPIRKTHQSRQSHSPTPIIRSQITIHHEKSGIKSPQSSNRLQINITCLSILPILNCDASTCSPSRTARDNPNSLLNPQPCIAVFQEANTAHAFASLPSIPLICIQTPKCRIGHPGDQAGGIGHPRSGPSTIERSRSGNPAEMPEAHRVPRFSRQEPNSGILRQRRKCHLFTTGHGGEDRREHKQQEGTARQHIPKPRPPNRRLDLQTSDRPRKRRESLHLPRSPGKLHQDPDSPSAHRTLSRSLPPIRQQANPRREQLAHQVPQAEPQKRQQCHSRRASQHGSGCGYCPEEPLPGPGDHR